MNEGLCEPQGCPFADSGLQRIVFSAELKELSQDTFLDCRRLRTVIVPKGWKYDLRKCVGPTAKIFLPDTAQILGMTALGLRHLREVTIPEGVTAIEPYWF